MLRLLSAFFLFFLLACVSSLIRPEPIKTDLPNELPKELKEHFDIREGIRNPATAALIEGQPEFTNKRHKRKRKSKAPTPPTAFVYPTRRPIKDPIWVGERLVYTISYLGIPAGDFTLEILPFKTLAGRKVYHIRGNAVTSAVFSLIYRLNDVVESFMDYEGSFSHRFEVILDESKQSRDSLELNDSEKAQTFFWNRWDRKLNGYQETKQYAPIPPFAQDSVSALYYVRTIPLTVGNVTTFPVISEGKSFEAVCTVLRREEVGTPMGRRQTLVLQPEMKYQGILKKNGESYLWLTDDERRIPVRLEAKVKIGTVVASLKRAELGVAPMTLEPGSMPSPGPSSPVPVLLNADR